jgi:hypothetical protein
MRPTIAQLVPGPFDRARTVRRLIVLASCAWLACVPGRLGAQTAAAAPVQILDVPYISQTEALCGGAAAAMVLRFWGERGLTAESFAHLVDESAGELSLCGRGRQPAHDRSGP